MLLNNKIALQSEEYLGDKEMQKRTRENVQFNRIKVRTDMKK